MKHLLVAFSAMLMYSCTESLIVDESIIDFDRYHEVMPVMLSQFTVDTVLYVSIGVTQTAFSRLSESYFPTVSNPYIENIGAARQERMEYVSDSVYKAHIALEEGAVFKIGFSFPELSELESYAYDTIPFSSKIISIQYFPEAKEVDNRLLTLVRLEVEPSGAKPETQYEITVIAQGTDSTDILGLPLDSSFMLPSLCNLFSEDQTIIKDRSYPYVLQFNAPSPKKLFFSKKHDNTPFKVDFYYEPPNYTIARGPDGDSENYIIGHKAIIYFRTLSNSYYKHFADRQSQFYARQGDPLYGVGEPVKVFSNIKNGEGIFASYVTDSVSITHEQ